MKSIISIFLTIAIMLHSFSSLIIIAGYELNKDYITKSFCVNKNKPMMHCNGMCHMQKQLKEQEKREQSPTSSSKEKHGNIQLFQTPAQLSLSSFTNIVIINLFYLQGKLPEISFSIYHPPTC